MSFVTARPMLVLSCAAVAAVAASQQPVLEALNSGARRRLITSPPRLSDELVPPPSGGWFDGKTVGACVVRRHGDQWLMWYAGQIDPMKLCHMKPHQICSKFPNAGESRTTASNACALGYCEPCVGAAHAAVCLLPPLT